MIAAPMDRGTDRFTAVFDARPESCDQTCYRILPAAAERRLDYGVIIDLGDRRFEVIHTPGNSPGGIGLLESATGFFLSGDIVYDGPLTPGVACAPRGATAAGMLPERRLIVHHASSLSR